MGVEPALMESATSGAGGAASSRRWLRVAGAAAGLLLLVAAVAMVWRQRDVVAEAIDAARHRPAASLIGYAAVIFASILGNIFLSGALFSILMSRYGKVRFWEMQMLIAAATFVNYVPMRPGLFGRIAYHKMVHGIAVRDSAKALAQAVIISVAVAGFAAIAVAMAVQAEVNLWLVLSVPWLLLGVAALARPTLRIWIAAASVRLCELALIAARYFAAFALLGSPIDLEGALAFASVSMIATMAPFLSNGLGLREWAIGLAAPLLTAYHMTIGMTADLMIRAGEIVVTVPLGIAALALLARPQSFIESQDQRS